MKETILCSHKVLFISVQFSTMIIGIEEKMRFKYKMQTLSKCDIYEESDIL